jgi:hypothetical protein
MLAAPAIIAAANTISESIVVPVYRFGRSSFSVFGGDRLNGLGGIADFGTVIMAFMPWLC